MKRAASARVSAQPPQVARAKSRRWAIALASVLGLAIAAGAAYFAFRTSRTPPVTATATASARAAQEKPAAATPVKKPPAAPTAAPKYAGSQACKECHASEYAAWRGSQHERAMQVASDRSVLGNFDRAKFRNAGVTSTFFKRGGKFYVNTDGPDGKLHDYRIQYTFGVYPLQQYLIELPRGHIQALTIAWDSRDRAHGGQRWFDLYPGQKIRAGDPLHWTGIELNWNYQCADCHSTNLRKNYDPGTDAYRTTWSEINVACEACHGPASNHLAWAWKQGDWQHIPDKGLAIAFGKPNGATWMRKKGSDTATRSSPRTSERVIETCGRCHSRRGELTDNYVFGRPLADTYRPSLLVEGLYWPDGQKRAEVYNYASFLQSKMYAYGVTCTDCHDPHTLKLRATGNAVCTRCHETAVYDSVRHTHHASGTPGAQCVACHMPTETYMVIDLRHDHSMRIPRPDRSVTMGVPNTCNQCHTRQSAQWAAHRIRKWIPRPDPGYQRFAEALYAGRKHAAGARGMLISVVEDASEPAIARATAAQLLARYPGAHTTDTLRKALDDPDPLVRDAAVQALAGAAPEVRVQALAPMLADQMRLVRIDAASALADVSPQLLGANEKAQLAKGLDAYIATQRYNADRPEGRSNLGMLYAELGQYDKAQAELEKALALEPEFAPAAIDLADLERARGDEKGAEATLRAALKHSPRNASLHFALGLSLVRQKRADSAVAELAEAARLDPERPRFAYVYGVALNGTGKQAEALRVLAEAHRRFTGDADILLALATMERDRGQREAALKYARTLLELRPDDPQAKALVQQLER